MAPLLIGSPPPHATDCGEMESGRPPVLPGSSVKHRKIWVWYSGNDLLSNKTSTRAYQCSDEVENVVRPAILKRIGVSPANYPNGTIILGILGIRSKMESFDFQVRDNTEYDVIFGTKTRGIVKLMGQRSPQVNPLKLKKLSPGEALISEAKTQAADIASEAEKKRRDDILVNKLDAEAALYKQQKEDNQQSQPSSN